MSFDDYQNMSIDELETAIRHKSIQELRYELSQLDELRLLDMNNVPNASVRAFFLMVIPASFKDAPEWFTQYVTNLVNLWRDGELSHQWNVNSLKQELASRDSDFAQDVYSGYDAI